MNIQTVKSFANEEVLLSSEFWDYISEEKNTMQEILNIINSIATTDFMKNFQYIQDKQNFKDVKYKEILEQWYLYNEIRILDNYKNIKENIIRAIKHPLK